MIHDVKIYTVKTCIWSTPLMYKHLVQQSQCVPKFTRYQQNLQQASKFCSIGGKGNPLHERGKGELLCVLLVQNCKSNPYHKDRRESFRTLSQVMILYKLIVITLRSKQATWVWSTLSKWNKDGVFINMVNLCRFLSLSVKVT